VGSDEQLGGTSFMGLDFLLPQPCPNFVSWAPVGLSKAKVTFNDNPSCPSAVFEGVLSTDVPEECKFIASGYAGMKTKRLPKTILGHPCHDLSRFSNLELVARDVTFPTSVTESEVSVDTVDSPRQFYLNIKATTYANLDLYQFPLQFESNEWHTFEVCVGNFIQFSVAVYPLLHFILNHAVIL
jgi:hypothetical protein